MIERGDAKRCQLCDVARPCYVASCEMCQRELPRAGWPKPPACDHGALLSSLEEFVAGTAGRDELRVTFGSRSALVRVCRRCGEEVLYLVGKNKTLASELPSDDVER